MTLAAGVLSCELLLHVLLVQLLDCLPIQVRFLSNVFDRHGPAAPSRKEGESLAVERIVRKPLQLLLLHLHAPPAIDSRTSISNIFNIPARQIPHPTPFAIVPPSLDVTQAPQTVFSPVRRKPVLSPWISENVP